MKLRFGVLCDEIRREDNGKLIFIGVYGSNILVPAFPAALILALAVGAEVAEPVELSTTFQVTLGETTLVSGRGRMKASVAGNHVFPIRDILLEVPHAGDLHFQLKLGDGDWLTVCVQPIAVKPST